MRTAAASSSTLLQMLTTPFYRLFQRLVSSLLSFWERCFGPVLTFSDSGIQVRIGRQIAEGGFSIVFRATHVDGGRNIVNNTVASGGSSNGRPSSPCYYYPQQYHNTYALKRISCMDAETRSACVRESKVHYAVQELQRQQQQQQQQQPGQTSYTMPLLGMTFCDNNTICYMLFPYYPHSLRQEVNHRIFEPLREITESSRKRPFSLSHKNKEIKDILKFQPWNESIVLQLFYRLCEGVAQLHSVGYSHRDIKVDNVLLKGSNPSHLIEPTLMDFGSAGPLTRSLSSRKDILEIVEEASQHTTISYRPPELFAGELRVAPSGAISSEYSKRGNGSSDDAVLDYTKCDVWMLGCTLYGILYGASPGECEFVRSTGQVCIVETSHNKVLGKLPFPDSDTPPAQWYSPQIRELLEWILIQDRHTRPTLAQVQNRVQLLLQESGNDSGRQVHGKTNGLDHVSMKSFDVDVENQVDIMYSTKNVL